MHSDLENLLSKHQNLTASPLAPRRYGVYEEGGGVLSLYLPTHQGAALLQSIEAWAAQRVLVLLSGSQKPHAGIPLPNGNSVYSAEALPELVAPAEAVVFDHCPDTTKMDMCLPSSLLAFPHQALPQHLGAQLGVVMPDKHHVVLLSRDQRVLMPILLAHLGLDANISDTPVIGQELRDQMLGPIPSWSWRQVRHNRSSGFQTLEIETLHGEPCLESNDALKWVAPLQRGFWRSGWSW